MKKNYSTFSGPLTQEEAIDLLTITAEDLKKSKEGRKRAVLLARDNVSPPLPFHVIAKKLGLKAHSRAIQIYQKAKGGVTS